MKSFAMLGIGKTGWIEKDTPKCGQMDGRCASHRARSLVRDFKKDGASSFRISPRTGAPWNSRPGFPCTPVAF